ncbi:MAG: DUF6178 family protein [Nitrospinaceae bacterium]
MTDKNHSLKKPETGGLPFPAGWISSNPWKVEELLSAMPVEEQVRCIIQVRGKQRLDLLTLSSKAHEVMKELPPEEAYQMIKEIGENDALPVLSLASCEQLQFIFDLEWWCGDKFQPLRALEWLDLLDKCDESAFLEWFQSEEFDQQVVLLQSLIKVVVKGEQEDPGEDLEGLDYFTLDGVYEIYFKVKNYEPVKNLIRLLRLENENHYFRLMETVVWYPVTLTVESAYRWRLTRTSERGIPPYEEAMEIYSRLDPEALRIDAPTLEPFMDGEPYSVAPTYPFSQLAPFTFLRDCLSLMEDTHRVDTLCWEMVYLANKVMVADKRNLSDFQVREEVVRKVLGYVNIGLQSGAEGDPARGAKILERTWLQPLFQVGYQEVMRIKWQAENFIRNNGKFAEGLLSEGDKEQLGALALRFPQVGDLVAQEDPLNWRDFQSDDDVRHLRTFLERWEFFIRFARHCLDLTEERMEQLFEKCDFPEHREDMDLLTWVTTALARFTLFKQVNCEPLTEVAAKNFLEIIFLPRVFKDEPKVCNKDLIEAFRAGLLNIPMAWTSRDKEFLTGLIHECVQNLRSQFGSLNPAGPIEWKFTHGLAVKR